MFVNHACYMRRTNQFSAYCQQMVVFPIIYRVWIVLVQAYFRLERTSPINQSINQSITHMSRMSHRQASECHKTSQPSRENCHSSMVRGVAGELEPDLIDWLTDWLRHDFCENRENRYAACTAKFQHVHFFGDLWSIWWENNSPKIKMWSECYISSGSHLKIWHVR